MNKALDDAIAMAQEEFDSAKPGTADAPKEDTPEWFLLRATALGLSCLKAARANGYDTPERFENFYKACRRFEDVKSR